MANSRMYLTCRHCGKQRYLAKGYFGVYGTRAQERPDLYIEGLEHFFDNHGGNCIDAKYAGDNARDHFIILEEGENYNPENNSIEDVFDYDFERHEVEHKTIKLPEDF